MKGVIPTSENIIVAFWKILVAAGQAGQARQARPVGDREQLCRIHRPIRSSRSSSGAQLELIGEDPEREGLRQDAGARRQVDEVPDAGLRIVAPRKSWAKGVFKEEHDNMIMVRDIELYSLCEHHMLPFFGKAHVAYIPNGKIVGLSKLPRIVDVFARRLQVQERLTEQIAEASVRACSKPSGVGVVIEAYHLCMMMRGVEKQNSKTITSALARRVPRRSEDARRVPATRAQRPRLSREVSGGLHGGSHGRFERNRSGYRRDRWASRACGSF